MCASTEHNFGPVALGALMRLFGDLNWHAHLPRLAVRPTDPMPFVRPTEQDFEYLEGRWGLLTPGLLRQDAPKVATFNARSETVLEKPTYRDAFQKGQRCVLLASAFHEWPVSQGAKQKVRIARPDGLPLLIAGLWNEVETQSGKTMTCTMLTRPVTRDLVEVHHRLPSLVLSKDLDAWLCGAPAQAREVALTSWREGILQVLDA